MLVLNDHNEICHIVITLYLLFTFFLRIRGGFRMMTHATEQGKPTLLIGPHLLEGTINTLNKPLAVLTRFLADAKPTTSTTTTIVVMSPFDLEDQGKDTMEVDDDKNNGKDQLSTAPFTPSTKWEAVGIVKRKIVFAKRPMPVVSRPS